MHIPDGFIDGKTAALTTALSLAGVGLALRKVRQTLPARKVPLLGLAAAFLFAAQMVNFPVAGGTSGHLLGGALVAALLGPGAAIVVVTTVLIVQCFLFADGGVLALGANIFNMAILNTVGGFVIYRLIRRIWPGPRGGATAMAFAGWCSVVLASIACASQLAWSGTVAWSASLPAMLGVHMLIGIGEGLISALVLVAIHQARPDLLEMTDGAAPGPPADGNGLLGYGLLASLGLAIFVAPVACPWPDGLESVAATLGFEHKMSPLLLPSPAAGYQIPGLPWAVGGTAVAGVIGLLIAFALAVVLGRLLVPNTAGPRKLA